MANEAITGAANGARQGGMTAETAARFDAAIDKPMVVLIIGLPVI